MKLNVFSCYTKPEQYVFLKNSNLYKNIIGGSYRYKNIPNSFIRDDKGDNISNLNSTFNELTTQYYAWKNVKDLDYYGFCHYRRYLCFEKLKAKKSVGQHQLGLISVPFLTDEKIKELKLDNDYINNIVKDYDCVCIKPWNIKRLGFRNNFDRIKKTPKFHKIKDVLLLIDIIKDNYPKYYKSAIKYFYKTRKNFAYNTFILNKELFNEFEEFQFGVLFKLKEKLDISEYNLYQSRVFGLSGEFLFSIFVLYLLCQKKKILYTDCIYVDNCTDIVEPTPKEKDTALFVLTSNNNYAPIISVLLESFKSNASKNKNYEIVVLESNITDENKNILLNQLKKHKNITLKFYKYEMKLNKDEFKVRLRNYSKDVFVKLYVPLLLNKYKRGVVLDCDVIFNDDPYKLFSYKLNNHTIGGIRDIVYQGWANGSNLETDFYKYAIETLGLKSPYDYINSGVFLVDFVKYRNKVTIDLLNSYTSKIFFNQDQDILNKLFANDIEYIPFNWNLTAFVNDAVKESTVNAPKKYYDEYNLAKKNASLIHYASNPKPWDNLKVEFLSVWWSYAFTSTFYQILLSYVFKTNSFFKIRFKDKTKRMFPLNTKRGKVLRFFYYKFIKFFVK